MKRLICALLISAITPSFAQTVTTVAGTAGVIGSANGQGTAASFNNPHGIAIDPSGNIYIANRFGHTIRKISPTGAVTTFAGTGSPGSTDGNGTAAYFNEPWAVACDTLGNVYVADTKNYKIRKINQAGDVTTVAGTGTFGVTNGAGNIAQFGFPTGITVSNDGSTIFVCDRMTNTIRKISNGIVTTEAGVVFSPGATDGPALTAKFDHPYSIALDRNGNLIIADEFNHKIRMLSSTGIVSTIAGTGTIGSANGSALSSTFNSPWGVAVDSNGDIFIGDANNFTIRKLSQGTVAVYAGQNGIAGMQNGPALQSSFNGVSAITYNSNDNSIYLCDPYSHLVRKVAAESITLTTSTGNTSYCVGNSVTLTASPATYSNYVFYEGATILGTSANGTLVVNSLGTGSHTITCTATNSQGQPVGSNTLNITVSAGLTVSINVQGNTTICIGESVTLSSSVTGTYLWSTGATTASITATTAGSYTVTVTNSQGCSGISTPVQITTLQPPSATVASSSNSPVCIGDSISLTAGAATAYMWSSGDTTQSIFVTAPGNYTVIVTNGSGCSAVSLPVPVNFFTQSSASITPTGNVLIVQGGSATLTANSGTAWLWSTGASTQNITVNLPGIYTVTVTDQNGCLSIPTSAQVSYIASSNLVTVTGLTSFCEGDSVHLSSAFSTGNQWFVNGSAISGATFQDYYAKTQGYYQVQYTPSQQQPVFSDSIEVTVYTVPNAVTTDTDTVCVNEGAILNVEPQAGIVYNWYTVPSGGTSLGTGLSMMTPPLSQNQSFFIELTNSYGCVRANRFEIIAFVYPAPDASFTTTSPITTETGYEILFTTNNPLNSVFFWDFGDPTSANNNSSLPNPQHIFSVPGDYTITLYITNQFGCADTVSKILSVILENNIFIPSGFTPNNDGNNDLFRVRGNNISYYDISIFNQWGKKVWHSSRETTGWNGQINGDQAPGGNYAYAIEIVFDDGNKTFHRGNISLIR